MAQAYSRICCESEGCVYALILQPQIQRGATERGHLDLVLVAQVPPVPHPALSQSVLQRSFLINTYGVRHESCTSWFSKYSVWFVDSAAKQWLTRRLNHWLSNANARPGLSKIYSDSSSRHSGLLAHTLAAAIRSAQQCHPVSPTYLRCVVSRQAAGPDCRTGT